jgi:hypothetical protein
MRSMMVALALGAACSSIETVRLQPETVEVGPGLKPLAGIQAHAFTLNALFLKIPGGVTLDRVVNQMLIVTAKTLGADKVTGLQFDIDPESGVWFLWRIAGWRSARAKGIAVQVVVPPPDQAADEGPEASTPAPPP